MPGDGKAVVRTVGVLALTLFAIAALRGILPGAPPPTPGDDPDGQGSQVAVVIMLAVSMTALAVSVLARARAPRPHPASSEPPRRDVGGGSAISWRLVVIAAAVLLAWLLIVLLLMRWTSTLGPPDPAAAAPPASAPDTAGDGAGAGPDRGPAGSVFDLLMGTAVALVVLSVLATVFTRRRPTAPASTAIDAPTTNPSPPPAPDLARAAERGLAEVGDRSRDPREAIIACYVAMEQELEKSPGTVPQASDTPAEVLARAVARRAVHAGSAAQLVDLFEEARFSPHVMNEGHRADAVRALQVVQRELQGAS
ncbi:MAG: DUF4129 domain-containing protein [Mycobacterium kyogaense]|uniref:DUF4129 domain-containing protein n=1 Tax=Mycobacterium kyogaense TaxID=2212479 RepID=UPI002FF695A0